MEKSVSRPSEDEQRLSSLLQRDVVKLEVLPRGDVALAQRRKALGDFPERIQLLRRHASEGQLHPDHLDIRLALPVNALL